MRAELIPLNELTDRQLGAWRDLADRAVEGNPFLEPDFVTAAAAGLEQEVALLVASDANGWAGCLPIRRNWRWHALPVPCLSQWLHIYCFLGTPLVLAERAPQALAAMIDAVTRERRVGLMALEWISDDGPVATALHEALEARATRAVAYERFERAAIRRRPESTYFENMSGKRRKKLRRLTEVMEEDTGAPLVIVDRAGQDDAYDEFLRFEASGWKGEGGTALASSPAHATFFRQICRSFAARGKLQLIALTVGERTAAMTCNLVGGDCVFCFKIAHDERLAQYSPGVQLMVRPSLWFHDLADATLLDSCAVPDNEMVNRLWPDRRALATVVIPTGGFLGRRSHATLSALVRAEARVGKARASVEHP